MALVAINAPNGATGQVTAGALEEYFSSGITLNIEGSALGHAPEQIHATFVFNDEVIPPVYNNGTYDARIANGDFKIDWGDVQGPDSENPRIHPKHRAANVTHDWVGAHAYLSAGTFTITGTYRDRITGFKFKYSEQVTIGDPEALYSGANTIFVDPAGTSTAPVGARTAASVDAAFELLEGDATPARVMVANDADLPDTRLNFYNRDLPSIFITTQDPNGPKANIVNADEAGDEVVRLVSYQKTSTPKDLRMVGIKATGNYDAQYGTGNTTKGGILIGFQGPDYVYVGNCSFSGYERTVEVSVAPASSMKCFNKFEATNWYDYGFFGTFGKLSVLDSSVCQLREACANGAGRDLNVFAQHGPFRLPLTPWTFIDRTNLRSGNAWPPATEVSPQPCFRLQTNGVLGGIFSIQRSHLEGGRPAIQAEPHDVWDPETPDAFLHTVVMFKVMNCTFLGDHGMNFPVQSRYTGWVIENCAWIVADCDATIVHNAATAFFRGPAGLVAYRSPNMELVPNRVRNCMTVCLRDYTQNDGVVPVPLIGDTSSFTQACTNHREYFDNMDDGTTDHTDTGAGPFDIETFGDYGIEPYGSFGYFDHDDFVDGEPVVREATIIDGTTPLWITPLPASDMKEDGTEGGPGDMPGIDFFGNERSPAATGYTPDRGPVKLTP